LLSRRSRPPTSRPTVLGLENPLALSGLPAGSVPCGTPSSATRKRKVAALGDFATPSAENGGSHTPAPTNTAPPFSGSVHFLAVSKKDGMLIPHYQPAYSSYTYPAPTTPRRNNHGVQLTAPYQPHSNTNRQRPPPLPRRQYQPLIQRFTTIGCRGKVQGDEARVTTLVLLYSYFCSSLSS